MRKMEIHEIDSHCYLIDTHDFTNDDVQYNWASTPGYFYAENKRTYKRHHFDWKEFSEFGKAIEKIWQIEMNRRSGRLLALPGLDY